MSIRMLISMKLDFVRFLTIFSFIKKDKFKFFSILNLASFFNRFVLRSRDIDLDEDLIRKNQSLILRKLLGVSIDECARLCFTENSFDCQIMTFNPIDGECKWSSLLYFENQITNATMYLKASQGYSVFTSSFFFNEISLKTL